MSSAPQRRKSSETSTTSRSSRAATPGATPGDYQKAVLRSLATGPRTLKQLQVDVAGRVGVSDESPVEAQLDAMVTAGIVEQRAGKFVLSQDGEQLAPLVPEPAAS